MKIINAKTLNCPGPVLKTRAAIEVYKPEELSVIVDNEPARQNVCCFLESNNYQTSVQEEDKDFVITGKLVKQPLQSEKWRPLEIEEKKIMVMCATDRIGFGDDDLGIKLMTSFIKTLKEMGPELWQLIFVNNGVKLTIEGSEVLPTLQDYANNGLNILVCGTCLNHFGLLEQKRVGKTTNMLDIVIAMELADKVINI